MPKSISDYSIEEIARILGGDVHGSGAKRYAMVPGPGHSAKDRSLRIDVGPDHPDGFVVHSHAGDDPMVCKDYVRSRLSLAAFGKERTKKAAPKSAKPVRPKPSANSGTMSEADPNAILEAALRGGTSKGNASDRTPIAIFDYVDADGSPLYQKLKYDSEPKYLTRRSNGNGGWIWNLDGFEKRVLHRLPNLIQFDSATIFVTEGETDAKTVADLGLCATTVCTDKDWSNPDLVEPLRGRDVIINADFDEPGTKRAKHAAEASHGIAKSVRVLLLPGLDGTEVNKDLTDWMRSHTKDDFVNACIDAPLWKPGAIVEGFAEAALITREKESDASQAKAKSWRDRFTLTKLFDIVPSGEPLWLVEGLIPSGPSLGVIFGKPKSGKTFVTADMFLHVAAGRLYCSCAVRPGAVVYITKEGVRGFQNRMMMMREHYGIGPEAPFYVAHEMPNFGQNNGDAEFLALLIQKLLPPGECIAAVILDTLARTMPGQSDSDPAAMSMFVENCNTVAEAFKCFVGAVHHSPRGDDTRSRGSNVLDGAADVIISVTKDDVTHLSTAKIEAIKDSEEGLTWRFQITEKRNQKDGFTPLCETVSLPHRNNTTETKTKPKMTGEERRFLDILSEAILETGQIVPASDTVPFGVKVVTRDDFKKSLLHRGFADAEKPDSVRAKISKYINQLAGKKVIGADRTYVWLPKP